MDINTRAVKEPRGFIRIIQFIFAILAFATTAGFDTQTVLDISCKVDGKAKLDHVNYKVEYPFNFHDVPFKYPSKCGEEKSDTKYLKMDFSSTAQFFVTVGVLCLLYSLGSLVFYLFMAKYYETNPLLPMIDLVATAILSIFWLAGSIAWAFRVSDVQYYTSPKQLKDEIDYCKECFENPQNCTVVCSIGKTGNWASLNVSLILGFGNLFVWASSCWFVFKETTLHRKPMQMGEGPQRFDSFGDQTRQGPITQQNQFQQQQQFTPSGY
ncbi:synaptophysin-like protein [Dinothrombium tinctorium]|uniref:Synaptophysin-like protein n=1 Tax=Dinothrombium tinctorium TaxID=1965070 RepID=A0A3S5WGY4_9ACAR|nr:synaptophysin-like protein [Dinothrombium tinctorium]